MLRSWSSTRLILRCKCLMSSNTKIPREAVNWPANSPLDPKNAIKKIAASSKVATLCKRMELKPAVSFDTVARALIDETAFPNNPECSNSQLAELGRTLNEYFVFEDFLVKLPRLPLAALKAVLESYCGIISMADLVKSWGVEAGVPDEMHIGRLMFTHVRKGFLPDRTCKSQQQALAQMGNALIGGIFVDTGFEQAKNFVHQHVLSRSIRSESLFEISDPVRQLTRLCQRNQFSLPNFRLVAESGRKSSVPVFVVGVYINGQKIGEGEGSSIEEARFRAASNAMRAWYLYKRSGELPSSTCYMTKMYSPAYFDAGQVIG